MSNINISSLAPIAIRANAHNLPGGPDIHWALYRKDGKPLNKCRRFSEEKIA